MRTASFTKVRSWVAAATLGCAVGCVCGIAAETEPSGPDEKIVELPPLEITAPGKVAPWYYAVAPGLEVLSRCGKSETREFVEAHLSRRAGLNRLVPDDLLAEFSAPAVAILYDARATPLSARDVIFGREPPAGEAAPPKPKVHFLPNLCLWDIDTSAVFAMLDPKVWHPSGLAFTPTQIQQWLQRRTPELPQWFVEGFLGLYPRVYFGGTPWRRTGQGVIRVPAGMVIIAPIVWRSPSETDQVRTDPAHWRTLLPMRELLELPAPAPDTAGDSAALWHSQATLFVRWALDGPDDRRRLALWEYVRRAASEPVTEALFRECFGRSYADVRDLLSDYLRMAVTHAIVLPAVRSRELPKFEVRLATAAELGRLKGTWERLAAVDVKRRHPEYLDRYLEQARQTFSTAQTEAPQDSKLFGEMGLFECDLGQSDVAEIYLDTAVRSPAGRPRPQFELARIKYRRLSGENSERPLSREEITPALATLGEAWRLKPALPETYLLATDAWSRMVDPPTEAEWQRVDEGLQLFPSNALIHYFAAKMHWMHGSRETATELVAEALQLNAGPVWEPRIKEFQERMRAQ